MKACFNQYVSRRQFLATSAAIGCGSLLLPARTALATPAWTDVREAGPFVCRATFALDEQEATINELPDLQRELSRVLAIKPPRRPIDVFLMADQLEHRKFLHESYPKVPYRRALFVKNSGQCRVYAYRQTELAIDLRHECTHALLHSDLDLVPLWLDEGIAEYFEAAPADRAFEHPHFDTLKWNMRLGMVRSIAALEKNHDLSDMSGTDYRFSWAWTHFMLHGPQPAYDALLGFLGDVRRGAAPGHLSDRIASTVPNATERMIQHFKNWHRPAEQNT
jgi:hypothetical protein